MSTRFNSKVAILLPAVSIRAAGFVPNRLFTADSGIVVYRAGHVSDAKVGETVDRLIAILRHS